MPARPEVRLVDRLRVAYARLKRRLSPPAHPRSADGKVLVHLGCGVIDSPGFINVDVREAPHIHHVHDVTRLPMFKDDWADLIYACHVLEHVSFRKQQEVLTEWRRVLKPSGILRLSVPDFDLLLRIYHSQDDDVESIVPMLLGAQDYAANQHLGVFNQRFLRRRLEEAGFREVRAWDPSRVEHHDFDDWAGRSIDLDGKRFPVSLNLEAVK